MDAKLEGIELRFQAIDEELASASLGHVRVAELARERAELEPMVTTYRRYRQLQDQQAQARQVMQSGDAELAELARAEVDELGPQIEAAEARLKSLLLPRDPQDEALIALDVQQALDTLPVDQRAAIVLVDVLGHSVDDAARVLGCPTGTVKSRCSRGRARLLPLLEHLRNPDAPSGVVAGVGEPAPPDPPTIVDPSSGGDPSREHR